MTRSNDRRIEYRLHCADPTGVAEITVSVSRGPIRLSELAPLALEMTDLLVERAIDADRAPDRTVTCAAGCGACCSQLVPISAPEAFLLADEVVSLEPDAREEMIRDFERIGDLLRERGMRERLDTVRTAHTGVDLGAIARDYFDLGAACPFLVDDSCSIYGRRPVGCRQYNVTTPAKRCAAPRHRPIRTVPVAGRLSFALAQVAAELSGDPIEMIPLSTALEWAEEHAALSFERWPGEDLLHMFVKAVPG